MAHFSQDEAEFEGFARPLWGIVPLVAGGGEFPDWDLLVDGIASGTDPSHPEYWGDCSSRVHLAVDMPALAFALARLPHRTWQALTAPQRARVANWLNRINTTPLIDNNWLFFRVVVNLGLRAVGAEWDAAGSLEALRRIESFYRADGWFEDGRSRRVDHYNAFAFHFYTLLCAGLSTPREWPLEALLERTNTFAHSFRRLFSGDGPCVSFGRSLIYRFAQGAFWGALAFAGIAPLGWPAGKGLYLRHLRWWAMRPILNEDQTLSVGYAYPNHNLAESYTSAASPYWAMKAFLPLALPAEHEFWKSDEAALPADSTVLRQDPLMGVRFETDRGRHVMLLNAGQNAPGIRHAPAKYAKFAYSTHFGVGVPTDTRTASGGAFDGVLMLRCQEGDFAETACIVDRSFDREFLYSRWRDASGLEFDSWLMALPPWHIRLHRVDIPEVRLSVEGAFAVAGSRRSPLDGILQTSAMAKSADEHCGIVDLLGNRAARILPAQPNSNTSSPQTRLPVLLGRHGPGRVWLACAVLATLEDSEFDAAWEARPRLETRASRLGIAHDRYFARVPEAFGEPPVPGGLARA